jgi:deoxyribodipyrimidine photolyase
MYVRGNYALQVAVWLSQQLQLPLLCITCVEGDTNPAIEHRLAALVALQSTLRTLHIPLLIFRTTSTQHTADVVARWCNGKGRYDVRAHQVVTDEGFGGDVWPRHQMKAMVGKKIQGAMHAVDR